MSPGRKGHDPLLPLKVRFCSGGLRLRPQDLRALGQFGQADRSEDRRKRQAQELRRHHDQGWRQDREALKKLAKEAGVKHVPLTMIGEKDGPPDYEISADADVTVLMWNQEQGQSQPRLQGRVDRERRRDHRVRHSETLELIELRFPQSGVSRFPPPTRPTNPTTRALCPGRVFFGLLNRRESAGTLADRRPRGLETPQSIIPKFRRPPRSDAPSPASSGRRRFGPAERSEPRRQSERIPELSRTRRNPGDDRRPARPACVARQPAGRRPHPPGSGCAKGQ